MASGTSSTTTPCWEGTSNELRQSPGPQPSVQSVNHVPGRSVSYVPGCSLALMVLDRGSPWSS